MESLVDADVADDVKGYLGRILERATPKSWVAGGATDVAPSFNTRPRNYETLSQFEQVYLSGGPITDLIDSRSLMTYGTGVEFATDETAVTDDRGRTVDEWLTAQFGETLDYLHTQIGAQSYWAGDAWGLLVETRGGDFSHVELVDPTTVDVDWDAHGAITDLQQIIAVNGQPQSQSLDPGHIAHFTFKDTPGGPLGHSLVEQNWDEITRFAQNQTQRANAIRLHGSPKYDVSVGSEGQSIPDKIMRRIRNKFRSENVDEKTTWTHGGDIEIKTLDSPGFEGMGDIIETDARLLAAGFGIPLEWTNFGSDGLGSGTPAESRQTKFERQARAEQSLRTKQFIEQVIRPVLEEYSPFPEDIHVTLQWGDVVSDQQAVADAYEPFSWAYTRDEIRQKLGDQPFDATADGEEPPEIDPSTEVGDAGGGMGGLFSAGEGEEGNERALLHDSASADALTQEELVFEQMLTEVVWHDDTSRQLFAFDPEDVPAFVTERLAEAVQGGALFDSFDTVPDSFASQIEGVMLDSLEEQHGWSVDSIAGNLQEAVPTLDESDAERIARTETQALVNEARELGYEEREDAGELRFDWVGPDDGRNSDVCPAIKDEIPDEGLPLDALRELVAETARTHGHDPREWTPHIQCRHTFVRRVEG